MVTRKPIPSDDSVDPDPPPRINMQKVRQELWSATDSEPDVERIWGIKTQTQKSQPETRETTRSNSLSNVPDTLRPGVAPTSHPPKFPQGEDNPWQDINNNPEQTSVGSTTKSEDIPRTLVPGVARAQTNPFKRKPVGTVPAMPTEAPPPPPTSAFSQMQISESEPSTNPWQPALDESKLSKTPSPLPSVISDADQESGKNIWESRATPSQHATVPASNSPSIPSFSFEKEPPVWDEDNQSKSSLSHPPEKSTEQAQFIDD